MTLHAKALRRLFCCLLATSSAYAETYSDTGLAPGTTYTYCVTAVDAAGNESAPACVTATTLPAPPPPPDTTPPIISGVQASAQRHSATITWTTDEASDSVARYGISSTNLTASSATLVTAHSITLTNLTRNTMYSYVVLSRDVAGNQASSAVLTFRTRR